MLSHDLVQSETYGPYRLQREMASDSENDDLLPRFTIDSQTDRQYNRFNATGTELTVRLLPSAVEDNSDAIRHFQASVIDLFQYALRNCADSDMVGITIHNDVNLLDKAIGMFQT
jgi:hypothetical protein